MIWGKVVPHFLPSLELPDHQRCSRENDRVEFRDEAEEIGVEGNPESDATMKVLDVIVGLVDVHVHGETFRPDFPDPKSNDVAVVEDDELSPGSWILNSSDSQPHSSALNWDLVGG